MRRRYPASPAEPERTDESRTLEYAFSSTSVVGMPSAKTGFPRRLDFRGRRPSLDQNVAMSQKPRSPSMTPRPSVHSRQAIGNVVSLDEGEVLLPDFIKHVDNGLVVNLSSMGDSEQLRRFVDRVFSSGACFVGLDCDALWRLLYPIEQMGISSAAPPTGEQRLADGIRGIPPDRRNLYKGVKMLDGGARVEYLFEPVFIERVVEIPIFGENADDQAQIKSFGQQVIREPAALDIDEFVAAMWLRGVRCGLDIPTVKTAMVSEGMNRVVIARRTDPIPGTDASVKEKTNSLHRDDSPFILPNGRVNLGQFKNHFPQVSNGTCLLQKLGRELGVVGYNIDGRLLEPDLPRDFELEDLAGIGTRIERTAKGEFLFAARDGFLSIDKATHQISITEKIVNRNGVSIRTTGNLALAGEKYEEFGEVQERRVVAGKHMSFHADVYGVIVSDGGHVHLTANLSGGSVRNPGGLIQIDQRVSQAMIDARDGEVRIQQAEGTSIVAGRVRIEHAVACDIVAEEVEIDEAAACTIAARKIRVKRVGAFRDIEAVLVICIPDFSEVNKLRTETTKKILDLTQRRGAKQNILDKRIAVPEIKNYFSIDGRIRSGDLKLSPEQQMQWHNAAQRLARPLLEIQALRQDIEEIDGKLDGEKEQLAVLDEQRDEASVNTACEIGSISGNVSVQTQKTVVGTAVFSDCEASDIKRRLRDPRAIRERLFRGRSGQYSWHWKPTADN